MKFYYNNSDSNIVVKGGADVIARELVTMKELTYYRDDKRFADILKSLPIVELSSHNCYWCFGARFVINEYEQSILAQIAEQSCY